MFTTDGLAAAKRNGKWGFVNRNGKEICQFKYDSVLPFIGGEALVQVGKFWGAMSTSGNDIVPLYYDEIFYFHD